jgi:hypothetical protein
MGGCPGGYGNDLPQPQAQQSLAHSYSFPPWNGSRLPPGNDPIPGQWSHTCTSDWPTLNSRSFRDRPPMFARHTGPERSPESGRGPGPQLGLEPPGILQHLAEQDGESFRLPCAGRTAPGFLKFVPLSGTCFVGWVERSETHRSSKNPRPSWWVSLRSTRSTHPT